MPDYVTRDELRAELAATKDELKADLRSDFRSALDGAVQTIITEMGIRFGEVNQRLDRMDATLVLHGKQLGAGARSIASLTEWVSKSDPDYTRVLAELADVKLRLKHLEEK
jgi:hypothetical protein